MTTDDTSNSIEIIPKNSQLELDEKNINSSSSISLFQGDYSPTKVLDSVMLLASIKTAISSKEALLKLDVTSKEQEISHNLKLNQMEVIDKYMEIIEKYNNASEEIKKMMDPMISQLENQLKE